MSTAATRIPLIRLFDNLIVSIQVALSDRMLADLKDDVTRAISKTQVEGLILDVSGVDIMDSYITRGIHDLALIGRWMGARTVLCGMRPDVAVALVDLGMDIPGVATVLNLESALRYLKSQRPAQRPAAPSPGPPPGPASPSPSKDPLRWPR